MACILCAGSGGEPHRTRITPEECHLEDGSPCDCCLELAELDRQLCNAEALLARLSTERCEVLRKLNRRHDTLTLSLPPEIVSSIFQHCMPTQTEVKRIAGEHLPDFYKPKKLESNVFWKIKIRQLLVMVCWHWRQIASSTPQLWTPVPVFLFGPNKTEKLHIQLQILHRWTGWSGNLPLSVILLDRAKGCVDPYDSHNVSVALQSTFDFVNSLASRWNAFTLYAPVPALQHINGNGALFSLQELQLECFGVQRRYFFRPAGSLKPSPRSVRLHAFPPSNVDVNWLHVIDLYLYGVFPEDVIVALNAAPQVERLTVEFPKHRRSPAFRGKPLPNVVHRNLRALSAVDAEGESSSNIWDFLTFPSLTALERIERGASNQAQSFFSMISRSQCPLQSLSLESTDVDIMALFQAVPSLVNLLVLNAETAVLAMQVLMKNAIETNNNSSHLLLLPALQHFQCNILQGRISAEKQRSWWMSCVDFLDALTLDNLPTRPTTIHISFSCWKFTSMVLPSSQVCRLPVLIDRAACKGMEISIVDRHGVTFLDYYSSARP